MEESSPASYFPPYEGRSKYREIMLNSEYVEDTRFKDSDTSKGYFCGSCEYMKPVPDVRSPTGYWCTERQFPDQPYGCCRYWEPKK
jgi:hypothetical protein